MRARAVDVRLRLPVEGSSLGCGQACALDEVLILASRAVSPVAP